MTEHDSRTISPSRFTAKKTTQHKYWGKNNSLIRKNQKELPICSITPLFNLLALCNKLNLKSDLMECMFFCPRDEESGCILIYPCLSVCLSVRPSVRSFVRPSWYRYMICLAISSFSFGVTALIFCRMFIHIMEEIFVKYSQNDK